VFGHFFSWIWHPCFPYLLDCLKEESGSEWKLWTSSDSSMVSVLPGSPLCGIQWSLPDIRILQDSWLAASTGFPLGSREWSFSWEGLSDSKSFWEEDCTTMLGWERGEGEGSLWDSCSFFMWWITEAAWKACCWKMHTKKNSHCCLCLTWHTCLSL